MELQDIVRRLRMNQSIKAIKRETGKHRRVIRKVLELAKQEGWLDDKRELPSEHQLQEVYHEQRDGEDSRGHPLDERRDQIKRWHRDGYSFLVIHELLQQRGVEYSETTVRRYIHRHFPSAVRPVMRRETKAGEVMEVDFGHLGLTWDAGTRSRRRTWVFSGRLRHSRRAYREVVFDQKQETFFACHIHAFEWFGGVAEKVTPDNLKAAVIVASFEDPLVNRAYRELALHYGFLISPCLPRRPEHKGGVEGDIKYVKRNFLPLFREAQKERGHEIPDAGELGEELERWNRESYDLHVVQKVGRTPLELFVDSGRTLPVIPANVTTESGQPYQRFRGKPSNFGWPPEWVVGMTGMDRCASASLIEQASGSPQQRGRRSHGQREDQHAQDQRHYSSAGQRARLSTDRSCPADIASGGEPVRTGLCGDRAQLRADQGNQRQRAHGAACRGSDSGRSLRCVGRLV